MIFFFLVHLVVQCFSVSIISAKVAWKYSICLFSHGIQTIRQFPGRRTTMGRRKVLTMSQVLSSIQYICFRKP